VLLYIAIIGRAVGISLLYHVHKLRYTLFHKYFQFQAAVFDFSITWRPNIDPTMLFDAKDICGFRWNFTYILSTMSAFSVSGYTSAILISGWTQIELNTRRCCYQQRWLRHPQKQTQQRWICFQRWFTPSDSMVTELITFLPKIIHCVHFLWRNSITGWTLSKISTSFHHAWMAIGICWKAMESATEIFKKNEGLLLLQSLRCSRVNICSIEMKWDGKKNWNMRW